jgi:hypothetical protein
LEDAEPVAIYPRHIGGRWDDVMAVPGKTTAVLELASGRRYDGPAGQVVNHGFYSSLNEEDAGQLTDAGEKPLFDAPPRELIDRVRFYASHRDRFDHPAHPRVAGGWELVAEVPLDKSGLSAWVPASAPSVLAGFTKDGKVARWQSAAKDRQGRRATYYAFAGDHYSLIRPGMWHFCIGCHPGHSHVGLRDQGERR